MFRGLLGLPAVGEALRNVMSFGRRPTEPGGLQGQALSETANIDWTFDNQSTLPATQIVLRTANGPFLRFSSLDNGTIYFGPSNNPWTIGGANGRLSFGFASGNGQFDLNVFRAYFVTPLVVDGDSSGYFFKANVYTETRDLGLMRDAAHTLAQRFGTNAQAFRLYETYTDSSNGAWLGFRAANSRYEISGQANGTGTVREVAMPLGLELDERTAPAAPAANRARVYAEDNGGGLTRIMARFPSGSAQQIAIEGGSAPSSVTALSGGVYPAGLTSPPTQLLFSDFLFHDYYADGTIGFSVGGYNGNVTNLLSDSNIGVAEWTTMASSNAVGVLSTRLTWSPLAGGTIKYKCRVQWPDALPNGTEDYATFIGHNPGWSIPTSQMAGFLLRWTGSAVAFEAVTRAAGTQDTTALTTPTAATWVVLEVVITGTTDAKYYVDGTLVATHTNLPTGTCQNAIYSGKLAGTTARRFWADWFAIEVTRP
jgi:hypothetical protein